MRRALMAAFASLSIVLIGAQTGPVSTTSGTPVFLETFDSDASQPLPYRPPGWDVSVVSHGDDTIEPMWANHGPHCEAPDNQWPAGIAPSPLSNHLISLASEVVFNCRDHLMTAMNAGYGAVYLTPPAMLDFRNGPATLEWDMSTERTSSRDWIDIVLMPFQPERADLPPPMALNMVDEHIASEALQVELQGGNVFMPHHYVEADPGGCSFGSYQHHGSGVFDCRFHFDGYNTWERVLARYGLQVSAARRDHFRIEVSKTHLKVGFRPTPNAPYFNWTDDDIPAGLPFDEAIVQLNQRAYNPLKPCGPGVGDAGHAPEGWDGRCRAGTWHWDNVSVSPAELFTIVPGVRRVPAPGGAVTFAQPAPPNSFIKAAGSIDTQFSVDNGASWQQLGEVGVRLSGRTDISFWQAIPAAVQTVWFRGKDLQDVYIYSRTPRADVPEPPTATPTPTETPAASDTATPEATSTPTPTATTEPTATATATATLEPICEVYARLGGENLLVRKPVDFCQ